MTVEEFCTYLKEDQEGRLFCALYHIDSHPEKTDCNNPSPEIEKE